MIKRLTKHVRYYIDFRHRLIIHGRGSIPNFAPDNEFQGRAPWNNEYFTEVIIGNGINYIGSYAFSEHSAIEKIKLSRTVEYVHPKAFGQIDLSLIKAKGILKMTEAGLFNTHTKELLLGRNQNHLQLPWDTKIIGVDAFAHCQNLITIECPESLETIGTGAFKHCKNLKAIYRIPPETTFGKGALKGTSDVRCYFETYYPKTRIESVNPIYAMTEYGTARLKDGFFTFHAAIHNNNLDPTALYECRDLIDMKGGNRFILGLRRNGSVVLTDLDTPEDPVAVFYKYGTAQRLDGWKNIRQIAAAGDIAVGLSADGSVYSNVSEDENSPLPDMTDITYVEIKNGKIWGMEENGCYSVYSPETRETLHSSMYIGHS